MRERILIVGSGIFNIFMVLFSNILVTRTYSKALLGTYQQAILLYSSIAILVSLGMPKAVLYFLYPGSNKKKTLWHIVICLSGALVFANVILYLSWNWICSLFSNPDLQSFYFLILGNLFFRAFNELFAAVAVSVEKKSYIWHIEITTGLLLLVLSLWICYNSMPVSYLLFGNLFLEAIKTSALAHLLRYSQGEWTGFDRELFGKILKYSFPLLLSIFTLLLARKIDSILISCFLTPEVYAVYSRGALEIPLARILIFNIALLMMPEVVQLYSQKKYEAISAILHREIQRNACLLIPLFFSFVLVHKDMMVLFYTEKYIESVPVFLVYLFYIPLQLYAFDTVLQAMNQNIKIFYISFIAIILQLIISIILLHFWGILGPALGALLACFLSNIFYLYFINKFLGISIKKWLPWKFLVKIYFLCFVCFGVFFMIACFIKIQLFFKISLLFGISYIFQLFWIWQSGIMNQQDKILILQKIQKLLFLKKFFQGILS